MKVLLDYFENVRKDYDIVPGSFSTLCKCVELENDDDRHDFETALKTWMLNSMINIYPGFSARNNFCIVFSGSQGIGKSFFFRSVCPPALRTSFFLESTNDFSKNDREMAGLMGHYFIGVFSLWKLSRPEVAKEILSSREFIFRKPYERENKSYSRTMNVFIEVNGVPEEETFNDRRFRVFSVRNVNIKALDDLDINLVWRELMA